jgi:hypothetical protein
MPSPGLRRAYGFDSVLIGEGHPSHGTWRGPELAGRSANLLQGKPALEVTMAEDEVVVQRKDQDGVVVEKKVIPVRRRDRSAPFAYLLVALFFVTYALVLFADPVGLGPPATHTAGSQTQ